jgi:DNA-binding transcriptional regulator YiaG
MRCGSDIRVKRQDHPYEPTKGLRVVLKGVEIHCCVGCDDIEVAIPRILDLHRAISLAIIRKPSRLLGAEIRYLRKWLGWSGQDFAARIGVTRETASRWENDREAIGPSADRALRLLVIASRPVERYPADVLDLLSHIERRRQLLKLSAKPPGAEWKVSAA